jgi:hypothetical protein
MIGVSRKYRVIAIEKKSRLLWKSFFFKSSSFFCWMIYLAFSVSGCRTTFQPESWYRHSKDDAMVDSQGYYYFGTNVAWMIYVANNGDVNGYCLGSYRLLQGRRIEIERSASHFFCYQREITAVIPPCMSIGTDIGSEVGNPISSRVQLEITRNYYKGVGSFYELKGKYPGVPIPWYYIESWLHGENPCCREVRRMALSDWLFMKRYPLPCLDIED